MSEPRKPYIDDVDVKVYVGSAIDVLRELPDESVDMACTSPPYFGLRSYSTSPQVWGGDIGCEHDWEEQRYYVEGGGGAGSSREAFSQPGEENAERIKQARWREDGTCAKCGAWRGEFGLEPTVDLYVEHLVAVFREVRRALAPHGSLWLNLGDSYASNPAKGGSGPGAKQGAHVDYARAMRPGAGRADGKVDERGQRNRDGTPPSHGCKEKDLLMVPAQVALALRADGWYLRSEIIWAKKNCMPESVTDRPTKSHEQIFLLTKSPHYYFDAEAVREPHAADGRRVTTLSVGDASHDNHAGREGHERWPNSGRNIRDVWHMPTQPFPGSHFAVFPEELPRRCILAGCPEWVCGECGKPRERIVERESSWSERRDAGATRGNVAFNGNVGAGTQRGVHGAGVTHDLGSEVETVGWSDCGHNAYRPGRVLDPFLGSGTTALVARNLGRHALGIELSERYAREIIAARLAQQSLFAESA